jgi:hypothetical protein
MKALQNTLLSEKCKMQNNAYNVLSFVTKLERRRIYVCTAYHYFKMSLRKKK